MCANDFVDMDDEDKVLFELQVNTKNPVCLPCRKLMIPGNHTRHACFMCPNCGRTDGCSGIANNFAVSLCEDCHAPKFPNGLCHHLPGCGHQHESPECKDCGYPMIRKGACFFCPNCAGVPYPSIVDDRIVF